ncbi:MAG: transporter [Pseudomonadota bacterium]
MAGVSGGLLLAFAADAAQAQEADIAPICTDRPTKANSTCTAPAGAWQVESDLANYTRNRAGGVRSETTYVVNPYLKYGLNDRMDLQVSWAPYIRAEAKDMASGAKASDSGSGDLYVRLKAKVWSGGSGSAAIIPFVKAPLASRGFGNDEWEGGVAAPVSFALPDSVTLTFGPELDVLADADGSGRHVAVVNLVNVARPLSDRVSLIGELWSSFNFDPAGTVRQYSADVAMTYLVTPVVQLDVGANFGLNRNTPDAQLYAGVSTRF